MTGIQGNTLFLQSTQKIIFKNTIVNYILKKKIEKKKSFRIIFYANNL